MIEFKSVSKRYGENYAVREVDLSIAEGELVVLIGPSGCGKTTTLKMVNRLIEPTSGTIFVNDENTAQTDPASVAARHRLCDSEYRSVSAHERAAKYWRGAGVAGLV